MGHDTQFYMGYFNSFDANVLFKTDPIQSYSGTASTTRTSSVSLKISNLVPGRFLICLNGVGTVTTGISSMSLSNGSVLTAW